MTLTIQQINKKISNTENYFNKFNMCSYEYPTYVKRYLGRLYKLKLKLIKKKNQETILAPVT